MNVSLPYRENVCLLICNKDNRLFLGERADHKGAWQFPQGGVEPDSTLEENVLREAHEELGVPVEMFEIIFQLKHTYQYDFFNPPAYAINRFRGQAQTFWLLRYNGSDAEIDLENSDKEFQNWQWVEVDEVEKIAEEKRLPGYRPALQEFREFVENDIRAKI